MSLSDSSPLGVPFYTLRDSSSEELRKRRIEEGRPGSPCLNKYLAFNTEFGEPLCVASAQYQKRKLAEFDALPEDVRRKESAKVLEKACICRDLGDGALLKYGLANPARLAPAVCPGPGIAYFSKVCSLKEMAAHIYGRLDVIGPGMDRPHVFVNEARLYVRYLKERWGEEPDSAKESETLREFKENLLSGLDYYEQVAEFMHEEPKAEKDAFLAEIGRLKAEIGGHIAAKPVWA